MKGVVTAAALALLLSAASAFAQLQPARPAPARPAPSAPAQTPPARPAPAPAAPAQPALQPPPPTPITDTFSGTLTRNGAATYPFAVPLAGTVTAKLTSVTPDNTVFVGFALGTWNGVSCQLVLTNDKALEGATVIGAASGPGNLCVRVYDVGALVASASYQVDVTHP